MYNKKELTEETIESVKVLKEKIQSDVKSFTESKDNDEMESLLEEIHSDSELLLETIYNVPNDFQFFKGDSIGWRIDRLTDEHFFGVRGNSEPRLLSTYDYVSAIGKVVESL